MKTKALFVLVLLTISFFVVFAPSIPKAEAMANVEPPEIIVRLPSAKSAVWKNRPMMTPKPGKTAHSTFSFRRPRKAIRKTRTVRNTKTLKSELSHHWPLGVVFIY